jgi:hypothetical protein
MLAGVLDDKSHRMSFSSLDCALETSFRIELFLHIPKRTSSFNIFKASLFVRFEDGVSRESPSSVSLICLQGLDL